MQSFILLSLFIKILAQNLITNETVIQYPVPASVTADLLQKYLGTSYDGDTYWSSELNQDQLPMRVTEYGYGFWFRFLTIYPKRLWSGKNASSYMMARLTINKVYGDKGYGDRILSLQQGQGNYQFYSGKSIDSVHGTYSYEFLDYPQDIEGLWTYVYFSHSQIYNQSVGYIQFGNQQSGRIQLDGKHDQISYFQLIIGGKQFQYPGFNGQIFNITFVVNGGDSSGAFVNDLASFQGIAGMLPNIDLNHPVQFNQVSQTQDIQDGVGDQVYIPIGGGQDAFPKEYSVSGWFKWTGPYKGKNGHLVFRLSIVEQYDEDFKKLGDSTLTVGEQIDESFFCQTYTYYNMNGDGDTNYYQIVDHQKRNQEWHFIYYGYSKILSRAYFFFQTKNSQDSQDFPNTNHYLTYQFYFLLRDSLFSNYQGQEALINVNLGPGAYLESSNNYQTTNDIFSYGLGLNQFLNISVANSNSTIPNQKIGT